MTRWARRHWLWFVAFLAACGALVAAVAAAAAVEEWTETGRAYSGPRCLP